MSTRFGDLGAGLLTLRFSAGLDALRLAASTMTIDDVRVRVACLDDLITSKEAAGRDKDFQALRHLIHFRQKQQKLDGASTRPVTL